MKITTDTNDANLILQRYIGANLQIEMYSTSLKRIALKLMLPDVEEVLYVVGIGCESLSGRFSYANANLHINNESTDDEVISVISDKSAQFSLTTTSGFTLAQGAESEFGTSFDNFILDKQ